MYIHTYIHMYTHKYALMYVNLYVHICIHMYSFCTAGLPCTWRSTRDGRAKGVGGENSLIQYNEFFVTRIQTFDCKMHRGSLNIRKFQTRVHSCTRFLISNKRIPSKEYTISNRVCLCMSTTLDSKPYARPLTYISNMILSYTYILSTHLQWKHQQKDLESFYLKMKRPWKGTSVLDPRTCISRRELPKQRIEPIWTPIHICTYICI